MESKEELTKLTKEELVEKLMSTSAQVDTLKRNLEIVNKRLDRALRLATAISDLYMGEQ